MALKKCKECGNDISKKADKCPHCGAPNRPGFFSRIIRGLLVTIGLFIVIGFIMATFPEQKTSSSTTPPASKITDAQCKQDLRCWADRHHIDATVQCKKSVERLAKYQHKWTDGFTDQKFSRYKWADNQHTAITYIGDTIQFQNGFGAWQNYIYSCDYNPATQRTANIQGAPGKL